MSYIASFDIGTTSIKGILLKKDGSLIGQASYDLNTIHGSNGEIEQNPKDWWDGVVTITNKWWEEDVISPSDIAMITFSGQMQDIIPIAADDRIRNAILYSDSRATVEADFINKQIPNSKAIIANHIDGASPFAKLLWLKKRDEETYNKSFSFLFSAKDYIIYRLTNRVATDPVTGATTGMMNLKTKDWQSDWLVTNDLSIEKLPPILFPDEQVGVVTSEAAKQTGFLEGIPVLCGCGDAGASTMGAGAIQEGDSYIYLGTTGWIAVPSNQVKELDYGIFNLAHLPKDRYISIAPLLNVGNVHTWGVQTLTEKEENRYQAFEALASSAPVGAAGLLFLPYIHGERFPVNDSNATGVYFGITPSTNREHMARALIEGLCFSFRQTFEILIQNKRKAITLIGGGTQSATWCQVLASILGTTIRIPRNSEYLPAIGAAASAFVNLKWVESYEDFADEVLFSEKDEIYCPILEDTQVYDEIYNKFLKLYPAIKQIS
ncbi:xylulokinase [Alkalihalobacterium alkalinitrilicum]|uniref:xylulokinase n=1 Tax=Alkalihalobacterium alkalinitrilicum TaxID=427920 RepID=UPI000995B502|nr:FGGY family carbohydrate kinase [Alkalihalobacterium alkalinitrilicum]